MHWSIPLLALFGVVFLFLFVIVVLCHSRNADIDARNTQRSELMSTIKPGSVHSLRSNLRSVLPRDFMFGVSTSNHQNENGDKDSTWALWSLTRTPDRAEVGTYSYSNFEGDVSRADWLGVGGFRFGVDWARLMPQPGVWNQEVADHYKGMLRQLADRNITPVITLCHFAMPMWVVPWLGWQDAGKMTPAFSDFARRCAQEFGSFCRHWVTINEPVIDALNCCARGERWPGLTDLHAALRAVRSQWLAHVAAFKAIHEVQSNALVSVAKNLCVFKPKAGWNPVDNLAAQRIHEFYNHSFITACRTGHLQIDVAPTLQWDEKVEPGCYLDYIGINHYNVCTASVAMGDPWIDIGFQSEGGSGKAKFHVPEMGWDMVGWSLFDVVTDQWNRHRLPIMIT